MESKDFVINQVEKRFEPVSTQCAFCTDGVVVTANDNAYITLYEEVKRQNLVVVKTVNFKKINVGLPRCPNCKGIHEAANSKVLKISLIPTAIVGVISFVLFSGVATFFFVLCTFGIVTYFFKNRIVENTIYNQGIFSVKDATEDSKVIQGLLNEGWSLTKPEA